MRAAKIVMNIIILVWEWAWGLDYWPTQQYFGMGMSLRTRHWLASNILRIFFQELCHNNFDKVLNEYLIVIAIAAVTTEELPHKWLVLLQSLHRIVLWLCYSGWYKLAITLHSIHPSMRLPKRPPPMILRFPVIHFLRLAHSWLV